MKVLHLLASGGFGGIETLLREYSSMSKMDNIFVFVWNGGAIYESMKDAGILCINMNERQGEFFHTVKKIIKVIQEEKPDVVITHHSAPQFKAAISWISFIAPNIKLVVYAHANGNDIAANGNAIKSFFNKKINEFGFKRADKVIAISESVKKSIVDVFSVPERKIAVIYNGTDLSRFKANMHTDSEKPIRMIYVGRLIKEKGVQTTLRCLSKLPQNLKWTFDVVGNGAFRQDLEQQTVDLSLTDRVNFLGSRNDIPELLKTHDIFIHMPEWEEGFGITVIEAMAAGLLCICYAKGGIPEIITDGKNGILVHSEDDLVATLTTALDKNKFDEMNLIRMQAVERAVNFDIKKFSKNLDDLIGDL